MKVEKNYVFDTPAGKKALADLFDGRSQLVIYHFTFGPEWEEGCPSCSFVSDHVEGTRAHLAARDVSLVMVMRGVAGLRCGEALEAFHVARSQPAPKALYLQPALCVGRQDPTRTGRQDVCPTFSDRR